MRNLPDRQILIRWMFNALGYLLVFGDRFVVHSVLGVQRTTGHGLWMVGVSLYVLVTGMLCWVTAAGLKRNRRWGFNLGVFTSCLLLLGVPWLTIAGVFGLYSLFKTASSPRPSLAGMPGVGGAQPTKDFWESKRKSKAQPAVQTIVWVGAFTVQALFVTYARRAGMPELHSGWIWWLWFSLLALANAALHEFGHAAVAWAAGYQLRIISVGPFTFFKQHERVQFRFDPGRLFESGGYMGAVPASDHNLRWNEIAIVAAGPATNALTCLVSLAIFVSLPGSEWQNWWWAAALNCVITGAMTVGNLIPVGYCDGTMLHHLIFWTRQGQVLIDRKLVTKLAEEADACHGRADFSQEIELKAAMLQRSLQFGMDNAFVIAASRQSLGSAYAQVEDWAAAEHQYLRCVEFQAELAGNPALAGNVWSGMQLAATRRHHLALAGRAYASAVAVLERQKTIRDLSGPEITLVMLAQAHTRSGAFGNALREIEQGLKACPRNPSGNALRASLYRFQAICRLNLGETVAGRFAAETSADLFRSPDTRPERRNLALENVADLGQELWRAGESALGVELLREGIAALEAGGASAVAAQYRIKLAGILRQTGRREEAFAELPVEAALPAAQHRALLAERVELHLASERPDLAIQDCHALVALWRAHPCAPELEVACAGALLAKAYLAESDLFGAEALALQAADVLGPSQHPDAGSCLITIGLARSWSRGEPTAALIDEGLRLIDTALLLGPAEKARIRESETLRVQRAPVLV